MALKDRVRAARTARGLTQQDLAEAADLSLSLIVLIENGRRSNMQTASARDLSKALGCSLSWLLDGEGAAPEGVEAA